MQRALTRMSLSLFTAVLIACSGAPAKEPQAPPAAPAPQAAAEPRPEALKEPPIWLTVADVGAACAEHIGAARRIRDEVVAATGERTSANTLDPLNAVLVEVDRVLPISDLTANVHPDKEVRTAAEKCQQDAMRFVAELKLDRKVFDALTAVPLAGLDPVARRFAEHLIRDYRRSGVDKDEATRAKLAKLQEDMVKTGQEYSRVIREDRRTVELTKKELAGLPEEFLASHPADAQGKIAITTEYPDYVPVENYADKEETRKRLFVKFMERGYDKGNGDTLKKLLELRHEYAAILGYPDFAAYNAEDKMVKTEATLAAFIDKVADLGRPRMQRDLSDVLARKKKDVKKADLVHEWDRFYYTNKIKTEKFGVDPKKVREYFSYPDVIAGLLALYQELYGVTFRRVEGATAWHESVQAFDVLDGDRLIGRFYLDMHPRDGKYNHAAAFPLLTGVDGFQLPSASLVCNFPKPEGGAPALMEHNDVITLLHELGHLMHHLLGGQGQRYVTLSGFNCEWDFVEVPSQLMEEWGWSFEVLSRFARHYETGAPIGKDLVEKMRKAEEVGKGLHVMRQMFFAALSYQYHAGDPSGMDLLAKGKEIQAKYSPYPYEEGTYLHANFGHLDGYSSMYYTYMWSLVIAKDIFSTFEKAGLLDTRTAAEYRKDVLAPGGAVDADAMVRSFLGRDYTFDAFKTWLEKE